ncbi:MULTISPECIES: hypothetical protein [unclassified Streptomyces]|uniref:hypothetical protein n=1 Tax=unclassified Streptomyces TaxID=2593676 RepID=UPI002E2DC53D|nr:hypothetical protein [Streptomyces sp. NBC_00223]
MKRTLTIRRTTANPRRTTLAHLKDASELGTARTAEETAVPEARELPQRTANPRRTVLTELPKAPVAP